MMLRTLAGALTFATIVACGGADDGDAGAGAAADSAAANLALNGSDNAGVSTVCRPSDSMAVPDRASPYDSVLISLGDAEAKLCYGRPSMRGREIFGGLIPYDTLWRTGANEPTTIHLPFPAEIAGLAVEPGSYSIYTLPGREQWTVIVNRSTSQWGIEAQYTDEIRAQDVGRAPVPAEQIPATVETFVITTEETGPNSVNLVLEWENTRVRIPITRL